MKHKMGKAKTLLDCLPYIQEFFGKKVVIKYGGSAQTSKKLKEMFARDILLCHLVGIKPIIVHGGGYRITELLNKLCMQTSFIDGQRVTTKEIMNVVEMVLCGEINNEIVSLINSHGAKAIGINGKDANFIKGSAKDFEKWGYAGNIDSINADIINNLIDDGFIPVIAPIASSKDVKHIGYNINADICASHVAGAVGAYKAIFLTDITGVLDKDKNLISTLDKDEIADLKNSGVISGGMIPKVDSCLKAINLGVNKAHIIDGRLEHSILLELFTTDGIGTQIVN